jgi:hypothetical protein
MSRKPFAPPPVGGRQDAENDDHGQENGQLVKELVSFFAGDRNLSLSELEDILSILRQEIRKQGTENHEQPDR